MTTPERGLFDEITEAGRKHHWRMEWETLKLITDKFEQRLAEAEAKWLAAARAHDEILVRMYGVEQQRQDTSAEIAQLRARCGELEKSVTAVVKWFEDGMPGKDDPRANMLRVLNLGAALTATPQPAQQDECTRAGKHDWGSITGGMSCYRCGTPWWANTPEPKPAQEQKQ